jgi:hypothetical protein
VSNNASPEGTPSAEEVDRVAEIDRLGREPASEVRMVEEESEGTQQAESLRDHEEGANVSLEDELPGGSPA